MDSDYDRKFEEMKQYIPFLDSMIKRLESSGVPSNPRQAQLNKIRSLRDLLQDKKKRMKMENLLKCEQVLINLYKKVEQRETTQDTKSDSDVMPARSSNLNQVRNKLKSVATKLNQETLPEIARASETEEVCVPGSKEPALFQRRPHRKSISPVLPPCNSTDLSQQLSKRNYTRVLVSPDRGSKRWSDNDDTKSDKLLFSRRSPRRIPNDVSSSYHKKERKKLKKPKQSLSKDLNITLNVPEERLSSLSTDDILSRIINCSDSDVDIATLRELRSQILGELKHTGVKEDISDLLLKSYKNKNKYTEKKEEIEEGELSDSESEAIESIYGSLVIMDKDKSSSTIKTSLGNDQSRKIQICLVINSDKAALAKNALDGKQNKNTHIDISDFESFPIEKKRDSDEILPANSPEVKEKLNAVESSISIQSNADGNVKKTPNTNESVTDNLNVCVTHSEDKEVTQGSVTQKSMPLNFYKHSNEDNTRGITSSENSIISNNIITSTEIKTTSTDLEKTGSNTFIDTKYSGELKTTDNNITLEDTITSDNCKTGDANISFKEIKTLSDVKDIDCEKAIPCVTNSTIEVDMPKTPMCENLDYSNKSKDSVEIPLLNLDSTKKQELVSEIDILQALKKEILGETSLALDNDIVTPLLHQPKITKVASAQEIVKNRISIEKYKQKSNSLPKKLFQNKKRKDDRAKKQSLKLTEKECTRFNFPIKLPLDESLEDDEVDNSSVSMDDIYSDLAPKSPDHDDFADTGIKPPVIIPSDPITPPEISSVADIDMRNSLNHADNNMIAFKVSSETPPSDKINNVDLNIDYEKPKVPLMDPRKNRRDSLNREDKSLSFMSPEKKPNPISHNVLRNPLQSNASLIMPNMTPNISTGPNMTPLMAPNKTPLLMTPNSRSFEMTPSRHAFDSEDYSDRKHVYAPLFPILNPFDTRDSTQDINQYGDDNRKWDENQRNSLTPRDVDYRRYHCDSFQNEVRIENFNTDPRDSYNRLECPQTPLPSFGRLDCPPTPSSSFGRLDCPSTPLPSFGRLDCPSTPLPSFGRLDCPSTPLPSFGRLDCPGTPLPSFGRAEMPMTPIHPFGCSDGSGTPVHSFGRNDYAQGYPFPNKKYGRTSDPRRNRNSEFDNYTRWQDNKEKGYRDHNNFNSGYNSEQRSFYSSESYKKYEPNASKNEINRSRDYKNDRYYREFPHDREYNERYGRSQSRDSRDNRRDGRVSDNFQISDSKKKYYRHEKNVSRDKSVERNSLYSLSRASSISSSFQKDNQLSVQHSAGRSFTIDTSINRTFQGFDKDHHFNARRQRAASVGRSIVKDCGNRDIPESKKDLYKTKSECFEKQGRLSRACSVGRDIYVERCDNLKDIKADLRSFKLKSDLIATKKYDYNKSITKPKENIQDKNNDFNDVRRKSKNEKYSPRKNYRDPRIRRESRFDNDKYNKKQRNRDPRGYGIVYSDDNISKGTILGPGCSVKNYKIPKIKRSPEKTVEIKVSIENKVSDPEKNIKSEKSIKIANESSNENKKIKNDNSTQHVRKNAMNGKNNRSLSLSDNVSLKTPSDQRKNEEKDSVVIEEKNKKSLSLSDNVPLKCLSDERKNEEKDSVNENTNRRLTRSAKMSTSKDTLLDSPGKRTRKCKKPVIYDSESDIEETIDLKELTNVQKDITTLTLENKLASETTTSKREITTDKGEKICNDELNSSFGDMFSDNITADPVLDNINALIADLDHDLDASKNMESQSQFTQEILLENMLENITASDSIGQEKSNEVSDSIEKEKGSVLQIKISENREQTALQHHNSTSASANINNKPDELDNTINKLQQEKNDNGNNYFENIDQLSASTSHDIKDINTDSDKNEAVVSTTKEDDENKQTISRDINEKSVAPDSTINVINANEVLSQESVPDSTNESTNDITSSNSILEERSKDSSVVHSSQPTEQEDTIGKFLSMLQDNSKINEFLSHLSEKSSENDKIKKKLEKLREIVLDDEDDNNTSDRPEINNVAKQSEVVTIPERHESKRDDIEIENIDKSSEAALKQSMVKSLNDNSKEITDNSTNDNFDSNDNIEVEPIVESENINLQGKTKAHDMDNLINKETDDLNETEIAQGVQIDTNATKKILRGRRKKRRGLNKGQPKNINRVTRSGATAKPKGKKLSRELLNLQADIREMKDDILGGTSGIRMCRLAKLVDEKSQSTKDEAGKTEYEPIVRIEKFKNINSSDSIEAQEKNLRKKNIKTKCKSLETEIKIACDNSKIRSCTEKDPYIFENDSFSEKREDSLSEYDSDSAESSKSERLVEVKKKPKRRRGAWQAGVIVPKNKKKKNLNTQSKPTTIDKSLAIENKAKIPDPNCFTDKTYCFERNVFTYSCRLCDYEGSYIVNHYKKQHPHIEIPLSRITSDIAREAIKQCDKVNLQSISKLPSNRYVCRFCFKEFYNHKNLLESFFWHIVSVHTGEYKQNCPTCVDDALCPFELDIPPPPEAQSGQLIGFICGICNYTQVSLENLKNHVIIRHHDKQTEVFTINMSHMSTKAMNSLLKRMQSLKNAKESEEHRIVRRTRSNVSADVTDNRSDYTDDSDSCDNASTTSYIQEIRQEKENNYLSIQSKITFENDSDTEKISNPTETMLKTVKLEPEITDNATEFEDTSNLNPLQLPDNEEVPESTINIPSRGIFELPHFKINFTESGSKEYVCCINNEYHYKTTLLISFKKHVQIKHSEKWDGYCCLCKVIVTPQGVHTFFNCLQHFLDKHFDNFPIVEKDVTEDTKMSTEVSADTKNTEVRSSPKTFLSVRPLSDLISKAIDVEYPTNPSPLPIIESVVSLGTATEPSPLTYPNTEVMPIEHTNYLYEEAQAEIMTKKNRIVLDAMMTHEKLVHVFKCAGRFCSFTTDSAEDALLHASTHTRVGGDNALKCAYCDYDTSDNAIELITHVFKTHGYCQYVCGFCFYRAAASQLVLGHIGRMHADKPTKTILKTSFGTEPIEMTPLSRVDAVPYYICNYEEGSENPCKFKSYTPGKFYEHITNKHKAATIHKCFICEDSSTSASELIQHLKTHGLKLYQCVWCVFGADNENELLAHASSKHHSQQPQTYLRVITNKEGSSEYRVLPLAFLNKSKLPTIEISPSGIKENPVREAERSVDLEKLIGHTTHFIESMATLTPAAKEIVPTNEIQGTESAFETSTNLEPRAVTPPAGVPEALEQQTTPIIKKEEPFTTPKKSSLDTSDVIVCLDSDEEDVNTSCNTANEKPSPQNVSKEQETKVPIQRLYLCSMCMLISKNAKVFKDHINACFPTNDTYVSCAHCSFNGTRTKLVAHYKETHLLKTKSILYYCSKCPEVSSTLLQSKEHLKCAHNVTSYSVSSKHINGQIMCIVSASAKKTFSGRKRSIGSDKVEEPPAKMKKFGPQDIDQLPINPIFDYSISCSLCEFSTKVRLNMVRHLQLHANLQPVPQTAPVNPVPHLETNEKHFDKMVNLASSSLTIRNQDRKNKSDNPTVSVLIPAEQAARYPQYVPERQRNTCGAKGCAYISVDENMLKYHWEALHSGSTSFHCVHCPSNQTLDPSIPLTAPRIIAHLKMHDVRLYACSQCSYYHYRRQVVEKHLHETHRTGNVLIVREEINTSGVTAAPPVPPVIAAPTMDLKPWQCGLCEFKSLLRAEVVDHCAKNHQSKMQYKCAYCAFRTSNLDNITKHQSLSHPGKPEETFYYYYREGTLPSSDGIPYWETQRRKFNIPETRVKTEVPEPSTSTDSSSVPQNPPAPSVDLNIVKQEVAEVTEATIEELCKSFGQFCEPNGLKYKCSLCKNVIEDTKEAMQSHLYEELKYRKWGCSICYYKAFHKRGLSEHMQVEHHQNRDPVELQVDTRVETWVAKLLDHQESIIAKNKEKLALQKVEILKQPPGTMLSILSSKSDIVPSKPSTPSPGKPSVEELENKFGPLGVSVNTYFSCPKCNENIKEESTMRDHLESELNKIRWCCSACPLTFQSYHQAQFHCKTHMGLSSRPYEAPRDSLLRTAWVNAVLEVQKLSMNCDSASGSVETTQLDSQRQSPEPDNSLLVVRYEERVPTPEIEAINRSTSEDERLIIDEPLTHRKRKAPLSCDYCSYTTTSYKFLKDHKLRHYGLQPFKCFYCKLTGSMKTLSKHQKTYHSTLMCNIVPTELPTTDPQTWLKDLKNQNTHNIVICLLCQLPSMEEDAQSHVHEGTEPAFGKVGEVIVKCTTCSSLHKDVNKFLIHNKAEHPNDGNYVFYKLTQNRLSQFNCSNCPLKFTLKKDLKAHIESAHNGEFNQETFASLPTPSNQSKDVILLDDEDDVPMAEKLEPPRRKVARKSTTKLPNIRAVARKSTTKLPFDAPLDQEYSFYGTRPSTDGLDNVTTLMPFYNTLMPFTYKRLTEVLNITPKVLVTKLSDAEAKCTIAVTNTLPP